MALSSDPLARGSVWLNRFEAKVSAVYRVKVDLSAFKPTDGHVPEVHLLSRAADGNNYARATELPLLAKFTVDSEKPKTFQADVELQKGETIIVHYENAPLSSDQTPDFRERIAGQLQEMLRADPGLGAAWMKAGYQRSDRGWNWKERIDAIREKGELDIEGFDPDAPEVVEFTRQMARQSVNLVETMSCYLFFTGPVCRHSPDGRHRADSPDQGQGRGGAETCHRAVHGRPGWPRRSDLRRGDSAAVSRSGVSPPGDRRTGGEIRGHRDGSQRAG